MNDNVNLAQVIALIKKMGGGSAGGGTSDYLDLSNKPQINGIELKGNKELKELGCPIFVWDGLSSDENPDNITFWTEVLETAKTQNVLVLGQNQSNGNYNILTVIGVDTVTDMFKFPTMNNKIKNPFQSVVLTQESNSHYFSVSTTIVNFSIVDNTIVSSSGTLTQVGGAKNILCTNINYSTPYEPLYDGSPATKKYVDDQLANLAPSDAKVFYWNGQGSDTNADNITLWQNIIDTAKEQTVLVYASKEDTVSSYNKGVFLINPENVEGYTNGSKEISAPVVNATFINHQSSHSYLRKVITILNISFQDGSVVSVSDINYSFTMMAEFLYANYDYETPYEPEYPGSPATKQYVDNQIGDIATILDSINGEEV